MAVAYYDNDKLMDLITKACIALPAGDVPNAGLMAAIALAESSGNPLAHDHNTNGSIDRGLWQINSIHNGAFPQYGDFRTACYCADINAQMAVLVWRAEGYKAWSTFNVLP